MARLGRAGAWAKIPGTALSYSCIDKTAAAAAAPDSGRTTPPPRRSPPVAFYARSARVGGRGGAGGRAIIPNPTRAKASSWVGELRFQIGRRRRRRGGRSDREMDDFMAFVSRRKRARVCSSV